MKMKIKIYVANLHAHTCGKLIGEWIELPLSEEELEERIEQVIKAGGGEEFAIHDYEAPFKIAEYMNPHIVNEWAGRIDDLSYDDEVIEAVMNDYRSTVAALDKLESGDVRTWNDCGDMSDVAHAIYEETGQLKAIESAGLSSGYVDWEAIGRDMRIEGTFLKVGHDKYVEVIGWGAKAPH
jgi:antirestriction protein